MLKKIKDKYCQLREWYIRRKAIRGLAKRNRLEIVVEKIMEQYATHQILNGTDGNARNQSRNVLVKHQQVIRVKEDFQDFLAGLK